MRKVFVYTICAALLMSGCGTYEGAGAYSGAQFGSILGSAIGGITDGPRGSDVGTIIGMAGGAAIGGAIGAAKDRRNRQEVKERYEQVQQKKAQKQSSKQKRATADYSGFDATNSGDDRLYDFNGPEYTDGFNGVEPRVEDINGEWNGRQAIEIRNARFVDEDHDGSLSRGELCRVIFEVYNRSRQTVYDIQPVVEALNNKHVFVSPGIHVESIAPGKGIRYTALVKSDGSLKRGEVQLQVSVRQGTATVAAPQIFNIVTKK